MKYLLQGAAIVCVTAMLSACAQGDQISSDTAPWDGIGEDEAIMLVGTEPFWNIEIVGVTATYTAPENMDGLPFSVARFAGNNGLGFSGELEDEAIQIAITPGDCSDGMSDRTYPYTATVEWGERKLKGCGFTDVQPFTGDDAP